MEAQETFTKNPHAKGPAPEIDGSVDGGTITILVPSDPGPTTLDPTAGWPGLGSSIQQAYTNRSLTQYLRNPETGQMELVPDLATDLGRPNDDFTEWTFTLRDDVRWEDGNPVTAAELAFGIKRSLDSATFPGGPGSAYSTAYFQGAEDYAGPYSDPDAEYDGIVVHGNDVTIKMSRPFPDMDWWGSFMAMGPAPLGQAGKPPAYGRHPLSTGPYRVESFRAGARLVLVRNAQWDPATDPARHQFADKIVVKFTQDQNRVDQIMMSGNAESQTAISLGISAANHQILLDTVGDRMVQQSAPCTSFLAPDWGKIDDLNIRKAIAWALPYEDIWTASGNVPGVTRVPAQSYMPPGMTGRQEYFVDGEQFTYHPERAKELLAEAGVEGQYELTMVYTDYDPLLVETQQVLEAGMKEAGFDVTGIPVQVSPYDIWLNPRNRTDQKLNLRGMYWCSDWPSGLTVLAPLLTTGSEFNTSHFTDPSVDEEMERITTLPLDEQPAAWGALDERIGQEFFPMVATAYQNELFVFGESLGNTHGDPSMGTPYYKDIFVIQ